MKTVFQKWKWKIYQILQNNLDTPFYKTYEVGYYKEEAKKTIARSKINKRVPRAKTSTGKRSTRLFYPNSTENTDFEVDMKLILSKVYANRRNESSNKLIISHLSPNRVPKDRSSTDWIEKCKKMISKLSQYTKQSGPNENISDLSVISYKSYL